VTAPQLARGGLVRVATLLAAAVAMVVSLVRSQRAEPPPAASVVASPQPELRAGQTSLAPPLPIALSAPPTPSLATVNKNSAPSAPSSSRAHAARAALSAPNAARAIVVIGDSHTKAGLWARVLGERLTSALPGGSIAVERLAIVGARFSTWLGTTREGLEVPVAAATPDVVVVALGTNDASEPRNAGPREATGLSALLARVRSVRPRIACFVVGPTPRHDEKVGVERIRDALRVRSAEEGCGFFDPTAWSLTHGGWRAMRSNGLVHRDGIHLTDEGQRRLGEAVALALLRE
jgi:lysophospholipase L1-like esterase